MEHNAKEKLTENSKNLKSKPIINEKQKRKETHLIINTTKLRHFFSRQYIFKLTLKSQTAVCN